MGNAQSPIIERKISSLDKKLQDRLSNSYVDLNIRIIVRGSRRVGKTCLILRLTGQKTNVDYIPTKEIAVSHVHWRNTLDQQICSVEAWDIVDEAIASESHEKTR